MPSNINDQVPLAATRMRAEPLRENFATAKTEITALQADKVPIAGGVTMTGPLNLPTQAGPPATPPPVNSAVTRGYLDERINEAQSAGGFVPEVPPGGSNFWARFYGIWEPLGYLTGGEMHWGSGRRMYVSGGLRVTGTDFVVNADPGLYLDAIGGQASFCGSKVNFYTWGGGGQLNAYITGNLYQSGGDVYISGNECRIWPSNGLYIGNGETHFNTGVRFSGGDVYMSGSAGLHLTAGLWVSGAPNFEISDWNYNIYMTARYGGQVGFCGSQFNIWPGGGGWPNAYCSIAARDMYISGGHLGITSQVSFSGERLAVSGSTGLNFDTGYGWDPYWSYFSVAGSSFYIESRRYGTNGMYRAKEMRVNWDLNTYWAGSLFVSGGMYISGGDLRITSEVAFWSNGVSFSGARFAVSGGAHYIDTGWGWNPWNSAASFCGSAFNMYTYRYGPGGIYQNVQLHISCQVGISGEVAFSGNRIAMSGYRERLLELWNGQGGGYAVYIHDGGAWKPGGGPWSGPSDKRLKTDVQDYGAGLKELLQLDPQSFRYNGRGRIQETGKRFVGIAAEQAQEVMPEMVEKVRGKLEYDDEEETDILGVNTGPLLFATLNAIKEIATTLKTIDQRLTALEEDKSK